MLRHKGKGCLMLASIAKLFYTDQLICLIAFPAYNAKLLVKFATKFNLKSDALSNTFAATVM